MPEGDTIHRTADTLRRMLHGKTIHRAATQRDDLDAQQLVGRSIIQIEARGKHLLIYLDDGQAIHSHLGMTGSWHVYRPDQPWRKSASAAQLTVEVSATVCVCFTPKTLEILTASGISRHPHLSQLGPDLLAESFSAKDAVRRLRQHPQLTLGEAVMNQRIVSGIGNVYKSEILFLQHLDPFRQIANTTDEQLECVILRARKLMRRNLQGFSRVTRFGRDGTLLWVYGRSGEKCLRCGTTIRMRRQGDLGRSTYWCPTCQDSDSAYRTP